MEFLTRVSLVGFVTIGWCVSGILTPQQSLLDAVAITLKARGMGTGPDGDSGWGKVWRAAAWAQLGDCDAFYAELKVRTPLPVKLWDFLIRI